MPAGERTSRALNYRPDHKTAGDTVFIIKSLELKVFALDVERTTTELHSAE